MKTIACLLLIACSHAAEPVDASSTTTDATLDRQDTGSTDGFPPRRDVFIPPPPCYPHCCLDDSWFLCSNGFGKAPCVASSNSFCNGASCIGPSCDAGEP